MTSARSVLASIISFCNTKPDRLAASILGILFPPKEICIELESIEPLSFVALRVYITVWVIVTDLETNPVTVSVFVSSPSTYLRSCKVVE